MFTLRDIEKEEIYLIKPLWEKLNEIHLQDSAYFKDHFSSFTFEKRCEKFNELDSCNIKIQVAETADAVPVGYCITTIEKSSGEIDSLFVSEAQRGSGLGRQLVENAIAWLKEKECSQIGVSVADGHEAVFDFYKQFGFYPRKTYLQLKHND